MAATLKDFPRLVGDIGGTNARFALVRGPDNVPSDVLIFQSSEFHNLADAADTYLKKVGEKPRAACIAVAGPVLVDQITLTNVSWDFSVEETRRQLALDRLLVVNDFLALAMAVPALNEAELSPIGADGSALGTFDGPLAVIGPGTGLGVAGVVPSASSTGESVIWTALATEGGHVGFAPETDREIAIMMKMREASGHLSAEAILSGPGLVQLHRVLAEIDGRDSGQATAGAIIQQGLMNADAACRESIELFAAMLGSFAGNVALTLGARGGVYLGGGVAQRLGPWLADSLFRQRFEAKGVMSAYLEAIPTFLITAEQPTFRGAARLLANRLVEP